MTPLKYTIMNHTPTLTGLGERSHMPYKDINLSTHIYDIVQVFVSSFMTWSW